MTEPKFFDVWIDNEIYVSSTGHYTARVGYKVRGVGGIFREARDYMLENQWFLGKRETLDFWLSAPAYLTTEANRLLVELLSSGRARFCEVDRDGNKRYEQLRYHEPERVAWLINILSRPALNTTGQDVDDDAAAAAK